MLHLPLLLFLAITHLGNVACVRQSEDRLSNAANCFTLNFYKQLRKGRQSNMVSAPFSLDVLLSMLLIGAEGKTARELRQVLGYGDLSNRDMKNAFRSKLLSLGSRNRNTLEVANSIWIQKGLTVKNNFKNSVIQNFRSKLALVDFQRQPKKATSDINVWVKNKTRGLIPRLFTRDLNRNTAMVLVNAMYFKGKWQSAFSKSKTYDDRFFSSPRKSTKAKFMTQRDDFSYKMDTNLKAQILEMDFIGRDMSMTIILPRNNTTLENLEQSLTCNNFRYGIRSGISTLVDLTIPRFKITSKFDLVKAMKDGGIRKAFENGANFSGISNQPTKISKAIQVANVNVYEEGTEASAATGLASYFLSMDVPPPNTVYFIANKPFLFLIKHKPSNLILFMGRVKEL